MHENKFVILFYSPGWSKTNFTISKNFSPHHHHQLLTIWDNDFDKDPFVV